MELHQRNLRALYRQLFGEAPAASTEDDEDYSEEYDEDEEDGDEG